VANFSLQLEILEAIMVSNVENNCEVIMINEGWPKTMDISPILTYQNEVNLVDNQNILNVVGVTFEKDQTLKELSVDITQGADNSVTMKKLRPQFFNYIGEPITNLDPDAIVKTLSMKESVSISFSRLGYYMYIEKPKYVTIDEDVGDYDDEL
jgi:hypothetical protein